MLVLWIFIAITQSQAQYSSFQCFTPNFQNGQCVPIASCQELNSILEKGSKISSAERTYLSRSQCGYQNGPLVCCASSESFGNQKPFLPTPAPFAQNTYQNRQSSPSTPVRYTGLLPDIKECSQGSARRIVGGNVTAIDEFPWTALLGYTKPGNEVGFHCGGVLISKKYALTASHCINGTPIPKSWRVTHIRLGEWDRSTNPDCDNGDCNQPHKDIPVEETIVHEGYQPSSRNQYNDIALIRLAEDVEYTYFIKPICLPSTTFLRSFDFSNQPLTVSGWGKTESRPYSDRKLKAEIKGVSIQECNSVYSDIHVNLNGQQICAGGEKDIDSCNGDSGGGLIGFHGKVAKPYFYLVGLVSFGPKECGLEGWPGVYTRVSSYIDWIESKLRP